MPSTARVCQRPTILHFRFFPYECLSHEDLKPLLTCRIAHIPNVSTAAAFLWLSQRCKKTKVLRIPGALYEENAEKAIGRRLPKSACFQSSFETLILNCGPTLKVLEIAEVRYDDPHWPLKLFSLIGRNCTQLEQLRVCIDPWGFEPLADFFIRLANVQGTVCAHWATGLSKLKLVVLSYTSELAGTTAVTAGVQRLEGANFSQGVEVLVHGQDLTGLIANLRIDGDRRSLVRWMFDEEVDPDCSPNFGEREHATASSGPCLEVCSPDLNTAGMRLLMKISHLPH